MYCLPSLEDGSLDPRVLGDRWIGQSGRWQGFQQMIGHWRGVVILGLIVGIGLYGFGGYSYRHDLFPMPQLLALRDQFRAAEPVEASRYTFDADLRLIGDETRPPAGCPRQSPDTAVLLVVGQSNAGNHAGQRYRSEFGDRVVNFFGGRCFLAVSPLLGSTGTLGEYWTSLGNRLVASGRVQNVVIAPIAYTGSGVALWAPGGKFHPALVSGVRDLAAAGFQPTHILWDQGEFDYVAGTSEADYAAQLQAVVQTLRDEDISAPFYITIASKCLEPSNGGTREHLADNPVVRAQEALSADGGNIRRGVNTDSLLGPDDRYDDCHIGGSGTDKVAQAWADILLADF
jgi:hypothetical protein